MSHVTTLIDRFKGGSRSAYGDLVHTFFRGQVAAANRRLGRTPADAEDIALSAFRCLWSEGDAGRPLRDGLTDRDSLLRTLNMLVGQKVRRARRDAQRLKRDARRTVREADLSAELDARPDRAPQPEMWACYRETWDQLMAALPPRLQKIVESRVDGLTVAEIVARIGGTRRTVERELSEIRSVWKELFGDRPE